MNSEIIHSLPLIGNKSVSKQVTDILTDLIIEGGIKVGDFMPTEEDMCHEFGIGRSSVREAIKTLESRGLVRKIQGKGAVVIDESVKSTSEMLQIVLRQKKVSLHELLEFRNSIEIKMTELAAIRADEHDIHNLKNILNQMQKDEYIATEFATYDYEFHRAIAVASHNNIFILMMETLKPMLYDQIFYTLDKSFNPERSMRYHEKILKEIISKNADGAKEAMHSHLSKTKVLIDTIEK